MKLALPKLGYYLLPPLICVIVFRTFPFVWFRIDDFAWLGLPLDVHSLRDLRDALFAPAAQGTIRVLSERVFFLVLSSVFGLHAGPFRVVAFGTWFLALTLIQKIGAKLTGSAMAGLMAAVFWSASAVLTTPLGWASAYNQILCAFLVLAAFYSRLLWLETGKSKWRWLEAAAYLAGFGALEVIVVYPAAVLLHGLVDPQARPHGKSMLWMFLPAGLFTAAHLFWIPKDPTSAYQLIVDSRLPVNLLRYAGWAIGPSDADALGASAIGAGLAVTWTIAAALTVFIVDRIRKSYSIVLFCCGWFLLFLAPVLALPNHVSSYYLTIPGIGLAWIAGWGIATVARGRGVAGTAIFVGTVALAVAYLMGSFIEVRAMAYWHLRVTSRLRIVMRAAEQVAKQYPGDALVLQDVDTELFQGGFRDDPFRLVGLNDVYLAPGNADEILELPDFKSATRFRTTPDAVLSLLEQNKARALNVSGEAIDITEPYRRVLTAQYRAAHRSSIETGNPRYAPSLGSGWFASENGSRWMGKSAQAMLAGPGDSSQKLHVEGYAAAESVGKSGITLSASVDGAKLGSVKIAEPAKPFALAYDLPKSLLHNYSMKVTLEVDHTFRPPNDPRDLGLVVHKIEVR